MGHSVAMKNSTVEGRPAVASGSCVRPSASAQCDARVAGAATEGGGNGVLSDGVAHETTADALRITTTSCMAVRQTEPNRLFIRNLATNRLKGRHTVTLNVFRLLV